MALWYIPSNFLIFVIDIDKKVGKTDHSYAGDFLSSIAVVKLAGILEAHCTDVVGVVGVQAMIRAGWLAVTKRTR